jgi:putative hydrolase of the HAD superfamily
MRRTLPTCLVFDLDDTLYLEREYVRSGFEAVGDWVSRNLGVGDFAQLAWALFEQGARGRIFDTVLRESGATHSAALIGQLVGVYRTHAPRITLLPDASDCLGRFHGAVPLALITDGPVDSQRRKVAALDLERYFEAMVFTDEWGAEFGKPHVRAFLHVQNRLRAVADRFVYIADNPAKDFIGPAAIGWTTVRIRRAHGLHAASDAAAGAAVDVELTDLTRLADVVTGGSPTMSSRPIVQAEPAPPPSGRRSSRGAGNISRKSA